MFYIVQRNLMGTVQSVHPYMVVTADPYPHRSEAHVSPKANGFDRLDPQDGLSRLIGTPTDDYHIHYQHDTELVIYAAHYCRDRDRRGRYPHAILHIDVCVYTIDPYMVVSPPVPPTHHEYTFIDSN